MYRLIAPAAVAAAILGISPGARAQQVQVGVLECHGGGDVGFILGSVTNLGCVLHADGTPDERYVAAIQRFGVDIGSTDVALAWKVVAPVPWRRNGDLAGIYSGGGGVLTGGSTGSFALQPLKSQDEASLALAASLGSLELRAAP